MKRIRGLWISALLLGLASAAWAGGELILTQDDGLCLLTVTPANRARTPVRDEILLSRGFQGQGIKDSELLIEVTKLAAIPPGTEILKATLKKAGHPGLFPPPSKDPAPFAAKLEIPMAGKTPAVAMDGEGVVAADVTTLVQEWLLKGVYTNLSLTVRVPTGTTERAVAGIQYVASASVRLEISYGADEAKHSLPAPVIEKIAAEPDRTISIWWKPALPQEQIRGQKYWYEFEIFLKDDLWQQTKSWFDTRKLKYEQLQAIRDTSATFDKIAAWSTETDVSLGEVQEDAMEKLGPKRDLLAEAEQQAMTLTNRWTDMVSLVPPTDPGVFTHHAGEWMPLDLSFPQVWTDKLAVEEGYVRLNLGPDMLLESAPYKFRIRVRCSNGQTGPWSETAEVQQRNPGYLVWMSRACYRGKIALGKRSARDLAYDRNVYDQPWGVRLESAKEEYEPFQVFFKNDQEKPVSVELRLGPLQGEKGIIPTWAMFPYQEAWIGSVSGGDENRQPQFPPSAMVDPLAPLFNLYDYRPPQASEYAPAAAPCQPGLTVGWWVDIKPPGSTPAGIYRGMATLVVDGKTEIELPVEMEVWDFFMPRRRTLATTFGDAGPGARAPSFNRWMKLLHEHRAGGYTTHVRGYPVMYEPDPNYDGDETLDSCYWDHYIRTMRPYVDGSLFEDGVPVSKVGITGWYVGTASIPFELGWSGYTANGKRSDEMKTDMQLQYLREMRLIAKRMGFLEKIWFYEIDEPEDAPNVMSCLATTFMHFKKAMPEAKSMVTSVTKDVLRGWITAYNTNPTWLIINLPKWFGRRQELGEEYWFYNSFTFLGDANDHMNQRFVPWYGWREGAADWLCWITSYGADWNWYPRYAGDGLYVYTMRGKDKFGIHDVNWAPNLQLKQYREGMEDIELCELAAQAVGYEEVRKIIEQCSWTDGQGDPSPWSRWKRVGQFRGYGGMNYNADPRAVYQARRELAQVIMQHKPDDGSSKLPVADLIAAATRLKNQGQIAPALATVKKALQKAPEDMDAGALEIACYQALRMPQEGLESALRLARRNAQSGLAWKELGDMCAQMSRFEDAHDCWQRALKLELTEVAKRDLQASIADSSLEGTRIARGEISPYVNSQHAESSMGTDRDQMRKWRQHAEGVAIYRGHQAFEYEGTVEPTEAGLGYFIAHVELKDKLPKDAKVRRAHIVFNATSGMEQQGGNIAAYAMRKPWINEHMTWFEYDRHKPWAERGGGKEGVDRGPLYAPTGSAVIDGVKREVRLDITRIFRDWAEGRCPNFGLMLVPQSGQLMHGTGKLVVYYTAT